MPRQRAKAIRRNPQTGIATVRTRRPRSESESSDCSPPVRKRRRKLRKTVPVPVEDPVYSDAAEPVNTGANFAEDADENDVSLRYSSQRYVSRKSVRT